MNRRWLLWVLAIAFVWLVVSRYAEIEQLYEILLSGRWQWVLAAALLQGGYYWVYAAVHQAAFDTVEVESRVPRLLPLVFAALFLNVAAPTAGASGTALFVNDAMRRKQSGIRAAAGMLLVYIAMYSGFAFILAAGLVVLFIYHDLQAYQVIGAATLMSLLCGMLGVLFLGVRNAARLRGLFGAVQRIVNALATAIRRPNLLADDWAEHNALQFLEAARKIAAHPRSLVRAVELALGAHLVNLASLFALFMAFGHLVDAGVLVAGYSMAMLFLVVSPTPQGIGVVEGVMALVFTSLRVPATLATLIALAFRGLSFWLPFVIGFFLLERLKIFRADQRSRAQTWTVRAAALIAGLVGVMCVIVAVTPPVADRLGLARQLFPTWWSAFNQWLVALSGFALLLLAGNLGQRKRAGWGLSLVFLGIAAMGFLFQGLSYEAIVLAVGAAVWLATQQAHFHAHTDIPTIHHGLHAIKNACLFTLAYILAGLYLLEGHFSINYSLLGALRQALVMGIQFSRAGVAPVTPYGQAFLDLVNWTAAGTLGYALLTLLRPLIWRPPASAKQRQQAAEIVAAHTRTSLAHLVLFSDKRYCFSPAGQAVIAYTVREGVALALGDPVGSPCDIQQALATFQATCAYRGWLPAFYLASEQSLEQFRLAGLHTLEIAHEASLSPQQFTPETIPALKLTLTRLVKHGHRARLHPSPLPENLLDDLQAVSDEWLTANHSTEKRFSMGWFDDRLLRNCTVMAVYTPEGSLAAFASLALYSPAQALTVDLLRHRRQMAEGTLELLVTSLVQWAAGQGYPQLNLGISALCNGDEAAFPLGIEQARRVLEDHINHFYQWRGGRAFKQQFQPNWQPRYLALPGLCDLPRVTHALLRADLGQGAARIQAHPAVPPGC